jgi:hypothetical protein
VTDESETTAGGAAWRLRRPSAPAAAPRQDNLWSGQAIKRGAVLPIISNYLLPRIFSADTAALANEWARDMDSPLTSQENADLARVAQYYGITQKSFPKARTTYHTLLKQFLRNLAEGDGAADPEYLRQLDQPRGGLEDQPFSRIASELGYPRFADPARSPMRLLAEMPLPVYLTTCQHEFLEVELANTYSKNPVSEVFYWDESLRTIPSIYDTEPEYQPTDRRPLVYHLFGMDRYPESLVVSEYDYLSVLMSLADLNRTTRVGDYGSLGPSAARVDLPSALKDALVSSGLLMLGYSVVAWEFRILFRWLVRYVVPNRPKAAAADAFAIQLQPGAAQDERTRGLVNYVTEIFDQLNFSVFWSEPEECVYSIWSRWKGAAP